MQKRIVCILEKVHMIVLCALLVTLLSACELAAFWDKSDAIPEEPTVCVTASTEIVETASVETEETLRNYAGILQTLANGDSYYTPEAIHMVHASGRTVLYYNNLLLVFTVEDLTRREQASLAESVGGEAVGTVSGGIHAFQIIVPNSSLEELEAKADKLTANKKVLFACSEYPVQIMSSAADENPWNMDCVEPDRGNEENPDGLDWWAEAIGAYTAWVYAPRCQKVRVGIVDDGFDAEHEDLIGKISFLTSEENNTAADHGTQVAGIIGAWNNKVGIRGIVDNAVLYCADLWPLESPDSYHTVAEYLAVINYMAQSGVRVVNNSWGAVFLSEKMYQETVEGTSDELPGGYAQWLDIRLHQDLIPTAQWCIIMISQLIDSGYGNMLHVEAAGNSAVDSRYLGFFSGITEAVYYAMDASVLEKLSAAGITYEAIDDRILIVGAVENTRDKNGNYAMAFFSNYGETVDICAPGDIIYTTTVPFWDVGYTAPSGTSLSAPIVTGSAAFLWALNPELTVAQVRQILLATANVQAVGAGDGEIWRYPMVNLGAAAQYVVARMEETE